MEYDTEPQMPAREEKTWPTRVVGISLIVGALCLAASLLSYNHGEMGWDFLNPTGGTAAEEAPCTNWLGLVGLYLAGLCNWFLGVTSLYSLGLLVIFSAGLVIWPRRPYVLQLVAMFCLVIFASALLALQPWFLSGWQRAHNLYSVGGLLGYLDGCCVVEPLIGTRWSLVAFLLLHATALIYFARFTFIQFWREAWYDQVDLWRRWRDNRIAKRERRRAEREQRLQERQEQLDRELAAARAAAAADAEVAAVEARRAAGKDEQYLFPEEQQTPLPGRKRSALESRRQVEAAYEEPDYPPLQSFEQQMAESRRREAERVETQRPPTGRGRQYAPASNRSNLLDLMAPVEEEIALRNAPGADDAPPPQPQQPRRSVLNPRLQQQVERRVKARAPEPAPKSAPAPVAPPEPAPRAAALPAKVNKPAAVSVLDKKDTRVQYEDYPLPSYDLLKFEPVSQELTAAAQREMMEMQQRIIDTMDTFKITVEPGDITRGPSITRYEFFPPRGLRVNRIAALDKDIMMATSSKSVNILAPIPGKNTVGIELENAQKSPVYLRELLQSENFNNPKLRIPVALGKDVYGNAVIGDLAAMPHTLVAGTTGSGKSVCINSMILSMLYKFRPEELKLILVDPKVVEMQPYRKLPHLICPVVTQPGRVIGALRWAVNEMERRYRLFSQVGVRNFEDFNNREDDGPIEEPEEEVEAPIDYAAIEAMASEIERQAEDEVALSKEEEQDEFDFDDPEPIPLKLPYIVIIIDELADLMMVVKEDLETYIARLTQKARAAGIHLVAATQTPRANVVTGTIKANIPSRIAFRVASPLDSRIILDTAGAENLLGKGDSLFLPPGGITKMTRVQGAFVSDAEIAKIIAHCAAHAKQKFEQGVAAEMDNAEGGSPNADNGGRIGNKSMNDEDSELYTRCVQLVVTERKASTSLLQRRFSIGYGRAAKIMDMMEENGVISAPSGATRAREVLVDA